MPLFAPASEKEITRALIQTYLKQLNEYVESDVIIMGSGPSGLMCGAAVARQGYKVLCIERNNYLGGGFWLGGFLINKLTARGPAQRVWDRLHVPYEEFAPGLFVADAPHACSALIKDACDGGVVFQNMTEVTDLVIREHGRVAGAVINWTPVHAMPRELTCVDPIAIESKLVVDATGHQAEGITKLYERGHIRIPGFERLGIRTFDQAASFNTYAGHDSPAHDSMWVEKSEDAIVEHTGKVHEGLYVCGMSVATAFGLPRMGPTFGGMLLSGERCAELVLEELAGKTVSPAPQLRR